MAPQTSSGQGRDSKGKLMFKDSDINNNEISLWYVHGLMTFAFLLIATSFIVMGEIAGEMDATVLTLMRFGVAAVLLYPIVLFRRLQLPPLTALSKYAVLGLLQAIYFNALFEALRFTTSVNAATLFTAVPFVSAVLAFIFLRERLNSRMISALFLSFLGAIWVIMEGNIDNLLNMRFNKGDAIFLISVLAFGLYTPMINRFYGGEPMLLMTFWTIVSGFVWLLLFANVRIIDVAWSSIPTHVYLGICYLAVFTTIVTFFITQFCSVIIGPTKMIAYTYLTPSFVLLITWTIGDRQISDFILIGVTLTLVSSLMLHWDKRLWPVSDDSEN